MTVLICMMLCCITRDVLLLIWHVFTVSRRRILTCTNIQRPQCLLCADTQTQRGHVHRRPNYKLQPGSVCNKVGGNSSLLSPRGNARVISLANNTKQDNSESEGTQLEEVLTHLFLIMDMSLAEMEGHTRTHKQARPIFDSGRDGKNKQGQRGERVQSQSLVHKEWKR